MRPAELIETCRTSHRCLIDDLVPLTDADFRQPSLLPSYSRGHLVTHIANKAKAHVELFEGAAAGETRDVHPVGYDPDAAATAGSARTGSELRAELTASFELLESAWDALEDAQWSRFANMMAGPRIMAEVISHHLRNVEVHHVDLAIGYTAASAAARKSL